MSARERILERERAKAPKPEPKPKRRGRKSTTHEAPVRVELDDIPMEPESATEAES